MPKTLTQKTFVEQGESSHGTDTPLREAATNKLTPQLNKTIKRSLTHGFFGEMGDEIISKQARDYAKETLVYFFQSGLYEVQNLMSIMSTNRGRDKIFGLVQYIIMLYVKCMSSPNRSFDF